MSVPVIHEMLGEYSPRFYTLRSQLFAAATRGSLAEVETALGAEELPDAELKKLRLLIARRWKLVAA